MNNIITGYDAIEYAEQTGAELNKYADPTEEARDGLTVEEAREIAAEDPSLVWAERNSVYIITEKQDLNSTRRGERIEATDLTSAKRKAARMQMFQNTVLTIEAENGALLATKQDGKWTDV